MKNIIQLLILVGLAFSMAGHSSADDLKKYILANNSRFCDAATITFRDSIRKNEGNLCKSRIGASLAFYVCSRQTLDKKLAETKCGTIPGSLLKDYLIKKNILENETVAALDIQKEKPGEVCKFLADNALLKQGTIEGCNQALTGSQTAAKPGVQIGAQRQKEEPWIGPPMVPSQPPMVSDIKPISPSLKVVLQAAMKYIANLDPTLQNNPFAGDLRRSLENLKREFETILRLNESQKGINPLRRLKLIKDAFTPEDHADNIFLDKLNWKNLKDAYREITSELKQMQ